MGREVIDGFWAEYRERRAEFMQRKPQRTESLYGDRAWDGKNHAKARHERQARREQAASKAGR